MTITIKIEATVELEDLESILGYLTDETVSIESDEHNELYGSNLDEQIFYLQNCENDELEAYQEYCQYHNQFFSESEYNNNLIGIYDNLEDYARNIYADCIPNDLPDIIENNIDWNGVAEDLTNDITAIDCGYRVAIFNY